MLPEEEKAKKDEFRDLMFKKKWAKFLKLCPITINLRKDIGKAPKCGVKVHEPRVVETKGNNKKRR